MPGNDKRIHGDMSKPVDPKAFERYARIGVLITRIYTEAMDALDRELTPFDISAAQYVVVSLIARGVAESAAQVCKELSYNPGAMTRMLDRLEQKDLVRRVRLPGDRRTVKLELTAHAREIYPAMYACSAAILERLYGRFSIEELEQFGGFLAKTLGGEAAK
ncbi:MAG: MarR family transcriptional regulator [Burkholderiales bacterium]|nr:MarR family transcriptional regulator [Burkholderiales bacterium]